MRSTTTRRPTRRPSRRTARRSATVLAAAGAALAITAGAASAHDCFVPMYSLNGPQSANWEVLDAASGAHYFFGYDAPCAGAAKAGYAALRAAGLPVGVKIFVGSTAAGDHTLAEGSANPNLASGKGLENFHESELPFQMVAAWVEGAAQYPC